MKLQWMVIVLGGLGSAFAQDPDQILEILDQRVVEYRVQNPADARYSGAMSQDDADRFGYRAKIRSAFLVIQRARVLRDPWYGPAKRWIARQTGSDLANERMGKYSTEITRYGLFLHVSGREHVFNTAGAWDRNRRSRLWSFCVPLEGDRPEFEVRINRVWEDSAGYDDRLNKDYRIRGTIPADPDEDPFMISLDFMFKGEENALGGYVLTLAPECTTRETLRPDLIQQSLQACGGKSWVSIP